MQVKFDTLYEFVKNTYISGDYELTLKNNEVLSITLLVLSVNEGRNFNPSMLDNTVAEDGNMLVVKAKELVVEPGVVLTPPHRCKGLVVFANKITNNGKISMTQRGCIAEGQDILLYKNVDGSMEFVPKNGGAGGRGGGMFDNHIGKNGGVGINRGSGGGAGAGMTTNGGAGQQAGNGSTGTSYSGGSGGGGTIGAVYAPLKNAGANGGYGGYGYGGGGNGAGNPSGGTGGLLIIYAVVLVNNGIIESNGSRGYTGRVSGGSSGGGSVNVFIDKYFENNTVIGTLTANGGSAVPTTGSYPGGAGGNGCITITKASIVYLTFLLRMNNNYYSIHNEFYDIESKMYLPISDTASLKDSSVFDGYSFSSEEFVTEVTIGDEVFRPIDKFNNFNIVTSSYVPYMVVKSIKETKELVISNSDINLEMVKSIQSFIPSYIVDGQLADIKVAFSIDQGNLWYTIENNNIILLDSVLPKGVYKELTFTEKRNFNIARDEIMRRGLSVKDLLNIDFNILHAQKIRFAFVLNREKTNNEVILNYITMLYDKIGYLKELSDSECTVEVFEHVLKVTSHIDATRLDVNIVF